MDVGNGFIKIAVYKSYGRYIMTEGMRQAAEGLEGLGAKMALAEYLESSARGTSIMDIEAGNLEPGILYSFTYKDRVKYAVMEKRRAGDTMTGIWEVQEIDTSRLWFMDDHDGAEGVRYFKPGADNQLIEDRKLSGT